ncbi:unnamed protein product [marine sediment metagenome]|uniref:Uncharacterized protein n=1 Tax=marine sediment metagenome TaxID=412755 RepID=X1IN86_9ZZZZ
MTSIMKRSAKHFVLIKAAREIRKEIEKAGLDNLKVLAKAEKSIVGTYLQGCSPEEKARYRRDLNSVLSMGITLDMLLDEVLRQMPELAPEVKGKDAYRQAEKKELESFLRGE